MAEKDEGPRYEYGGMMAAAWDLLRGDTSSWPDRGFYRQIIARSGEPALDVGCGTGRLLLDYQAAGIDIDGVDNSPEMLAICREKARALGVTPGLYEQEMQALELPRRYRTVLVPSSSFQLLTDPDDAAQAMRRFVEHMEQGGTLVMSFMVHDVAAKLAQMAWSPWRVAGERARPEDGATVRRSSRVRFDFEQQLEHTEDVYEILRDGVVVETERHRRSPAVRWYTQEQCRTLYERAGLRDVQLTSGFTETPAAPEEALWCAIGVRG